MKLLIYLFQFSFCVIYPETCFNSFDQYSCGIFGQASDHARIFGGDISEEGYWPWIARIIVTNTQEFCTGSFISDSWIVSAAHCFQNVYRYDGIRIHLSLGDMREMNVSNAIEYRVTKPVIIHEHFQTVNGVLLNDIALLNVVEVMDSPSENKVAQFFNPVCMENGSLELLKEEDSECMVAGYGLISEADGGEINGRLNFAKMDFVDWKNCNETNFELGIHHLEDEHFDRFFCAGTIYESDSCTGDSGGPLMCRRTESCQWNLVGIVSFGPSPCGNGFGVYLNIAHYSDFITGNSDAQFNTAVTSSQEQTSTTIENSTNLPEITTNVNLTTIEPNNMNFTTEYSRTNENGTACCGEIVINATRKGMQEIDIPYRFDGVYLIVDHPVQQPYIQSALNASGLPSDTAFTEYTRDDGQFAITKVFYNQIPYWFVHPNKADLVLDSDWMRTTDNSSLPDRKCFLVENVYLDAYFLLTYSQVFSEDTQKWEEITVQYTCRMESQQTIRTTKMPTTTTNISIEAEVTTRSNSLTATLCSVLTASLLYSLL